MIADAFTKRHGNSVSMMFLRSGQFSIVDEHKEVASRRTFREEHGPNLRFHRQREGQAHRFGGIETTIRSWLRKDRDPNLEAKLSVARNRGQFQGSRSNSRTRGRLGNEMRSVSKNLLCHVRETHEQDVVDSLYNLDFREGLLHGICLRALRTRVLSAAYFPVFDGRDSRGTVEKASFRDQLFAKD